MDEKATAERPTKSRFLRMLLWLALAVAIVVLIPPAIYVAFKKPTPVPEPVAPVLITDTAAWLDGGSLELYLRDSSGTYYDVLLQITNFRESRKGSVPDRYVLLWRPSDDAPYENIARNPTDKPNLLQAITLAAEYRREHPEKESDTGRDRHQGVIDAALVKISLMDKYLPQ